MTRGSRGVGGGTIALSAIVLLVVGAFAVFSQQSSERAIGQNLCHLSGPDGFGIVVLDVTDDVTDVQRLDITNRVLAWVDDLPENSLLQVVAVAPREEVGWQKNGMCKPEVIGNPLISNPTIEQQRQAEFAVWLDARLTSTLDMGSRAQSPILETLQWVGLSVASLSSDAISRSRFLLVSDLIQNTPTLSLIGEPVNFEKFSGSKVSEKLRAPLAGATFEIHALTRSASLEPLELVLWWEKWLKTCGAELTQVVRIVG